MCVQDPLGVDMKTIRDTIVVFGYFIWGSVLIIGGASVAGLVVHSFEPGDSSSGRCERAVVRERRREKDASGRATGRELGYDYAYTLGLHRMDDRLEAYLAARPRRPTDARSVAPSGLFQLERGRERRDGW